MVRGRLPYRRVGSASPRPAAAPAWSRSSAVDTSRLAGADAAGRVMRYTPNPFRGGSSVSHWDTSALHNLLMEPAINADLTQSVVPPQDLTLPFFKDIGW